MCFSNAFFIMQMLLNHELTEKSENWKTLKCFKNCIFLYLKIRTLDVCGIEVYEWLAKSYCLLYQWEVWKEKHFCIVWVSGNNISKLSLFRMSPIRGFVWQGADEALLHWLPCLVWYRGLMQVKYSCMLSGFMYVWLFATLWTVVLQAPLPRDSPGKGTRVACHFLLTS